MLPENDYEYEEDGEQEHLLRIIFKSNFVSFFAGDALTQKAVIYFTHSTPFEAFLTALGIARDAVPLRADNYYQQTQRQWRTSTLSPFAANLAVVLYR